MTMKYTDNPVLQNSPTSTAISFNDFAAMAFIKINLIH